MPMGRSIFKDAPSIKADKIILRFFENIMLRKADANIL